MFRHNEGLCRNYEIASWSLSEAKRQTRNDNGASATLRN
jgi:hypothetical protein